MIIGIKKKSKENQIICIELNVDDGRINLSSQKGKLSNINNYISNYNGLSINDKLSYLSLCEDCSDEDLVEKLSQKLVDDIHLNSITIEDYTFSDTNLRNVRLYMGPSIDYIDCLASFSNRDIPNELIDGLRDGINSIVNFDINVDSSEKNIALNEYAIFVGKTSRFRDRYRGCIGVILGERETVENEETKTELLLGFLGKSTRLWADECNLVRFNDTL